MLGCAPLYAYACTLSFQPIAGNLAKVQSPYHLSYSEVSFSFDVVRPMLVRLHALFIVPALSRSLLPCLSSYINEVVPASPL